MTQHELPVESVLHPVGVGRCYLATYMLKSAFQIQQIRLADIERRKVSNVEGVEEAGYLKVTTGSGEGWVRKTLMRK